MEKLWKFLNAPLVVTLVAITTFPLLIGLTAGIATRIWVEDVTEAVVEEVVSPFTQMGSDQDNEEQEKLAIIDKVSVSNIDFAPTNWDSKVKIIGTLDNDSDKILKRFHVTASLYEGENLVNVSNQWLSNTRALMPGKSTNFGLTLDVGEDNKENTLSNMRPEVEVAKFEIMEPKEE